MTEQFSNFPWRALIQFLTRWDLCALRLVSWDIRKQLDELLIRREELIHFIKRANDPRYLLRTLHVPKQLQNTIKPVTTVVVRRPPYPQPSPWNISVMTMVSYLSTPVDLRSVFHCVDVVDFYDLTGTQLQDLEQCKDEECCERMLQTLDPTIFGGPQEQQRIHHDRLMRASILGGSTNLSEPHKPQQRFAPAEECIEEECNCLYGFFPGILDIHYANFCRGNPEFAEVKAKKRNRSTATRTFENQCTMRICMSPSEPDDSGKQSWNIVNLKMFQNGKIQMTGCKSIEQAKGAVSVLLNKLKVQAPAMRAKRDCMTQLRCYSLNRDDESSCHMGSALLQSITEAVAIWDGGNRDGDFHLVCDSKEVFKLILLHTDNESLFACRRVCRLFRDIVESEQFWHDKSEKEMRCICERDPKRGTWYLTHKFNGRFNRMERVKNAEHFSHPRDLYCRYSSQGLRRHRPFIVCENFEELHVEKSTIAMINSDFKVNFDLNLPVLFKILLQEYKTRSYVSVAATEGRITQASYSPDDYVALKAKYESPIIVGDHIDPSDDDSELVPVEMSGDRTIISFFIFRTGSVIINSARTIEQEVDAYNFINALFKKHYDKIWQQPCSDKKKKNRK